MRNLYISLLLIMHLEVFAQNKLFIPPLLSGTNFNLNVQSGFRQFYDTIKTPTYGINGSFLGPTLLVKKEDSITLNVINNLNVKTTMHWHGLHVAPEHDGGPHQIIKPGATWSPSFRVRNLAGTYWYHPHGAGQTDPQVARGLAGMLIVQDSKEGALLLPRTYGVDDIPIIIQTKAFDALKQIAIATEMDTALFVNGTLHASVDLPAQLVRLRLLNGSSMRTYNLGLKSGRNMYKIASDGGLLDSSKTLKTVRLAPGERVEILLDNTGLAGTADSLMNFGALLPAGIYGADSIGDTSNEIHGYESNLLNGSDYPILYIQYSNATANAVFQIPVALTPFEHMDTLMINQRRTIIMDTIRLLPGEKPNLAEGPFGMNNRSFDMDSINEKVALGNKEIWTLINNTMTAHPFHIHDVEFQVMTKQNEISRIENIGWKDVVLVMPGETLSFVTQFNDFYNNSIPYMYHCHLLHHEDDGMMGSFLVTDTTNLGLTLETKMDIVIELFPNPANSELYIWLGESRQINDIGLLDAVGNRLNNNISRSGDNYVVDISRLASGIYFLELNNFQNTGGQLRVYRKFIKN